MGKSLTLLLLFLLNFSFSQGVKKNLPKSSNIKNENIKSKTISDKNSKENNETKDLFYEQDLDVRPEYPGGISAFYKLISNNFNLVPDVSGLNDKVIIEFVIEKDGSLSNFKVIKDVGYGCAKEAIRVLKKSEIWKPGEINGKPVRHAFKIPINIVTSK